MFKKLLSSFIFLCLLTSSSYAETQDKTLDRLENYLGKMKTAQGRFIQVGPDGVISEGDFALKRPGKMFFDYAPPTKMKVISDGFWVAVEDEKLETANRYPLSETPLKILLAEKPDFTNSEYKIKLTEKEGNILVDATDPDAPEQGSITLVFTDNPISLRQWVVTDAQGLKTVVSLQDIKENGPVENKKFFINNDVKKRY